MAGRLEAGDFVGVEICNSELEILACLAHKKNVLAFKSFE